MILLIDNYDSFTYNLYGYFQQLRLSVTVIKNDQWNLAQIDKAKPKIIVLSPGPGRPETAGITLPVIERFAGHIPLLGICLGHQAIAQAYGAEIIKALSPMHGKIASIEHDNRTIFAHLPQPLNVVRYHSLVVAPHTLPTEMEISATTVDGLIMGIRHKTDPVEGVQFHPEAISTESGLLLLRQFIATYATEMLH